MSNLQTYYHSKLDFQKVEQHTRSKWLTYDTSGRKDNQLQAWNSPVVYNNSECNFFLTLILCEKDMNLSWHTGPRQIGTIFQTAIFGCLFYKWKCLNFD